MQGDPLAQLRDIHLPEPVSAWPPGPGWWLLAVLLLAALVAIATWALRRYRSNGWRRQARRELTLAYRAWQSSGDTGRFLQQLNEILKRAALNQSRQAGLVGLCGEEWSRYLDAQWRRTPEHGFSALGFAELIYQPNPAAADVDSLYGLGQQWLANFRGSAC
jgi:hypothetical protein